MGNHVHLLLKEGQKEISSIMKKIGASYVYWYNWKYERTGHLFQDRYRSEPVENDVYLLTVVRYIHQNPIKAGIADSPENYLWSSYNEYMKCKKIVTTELVFEMFKNIKEFEKYMNDHADDECMEIEEDRRLNDEEVKTIIKNLTRKSDPMALQKMELTKRNEIIVELKKAEGVSIRQISRLTGINRNIIQRL